MARALISFDWAIKRLLRQKANYGILEGFLSVLLKEDIKIINIPESESNKLSVVDKYNKVDILCESNKKELILIELQYNNEYDYFHRMLFSTSKLITDYMYEGEQYNQVKKVISVNILYFDLGQGNDYVYYGSTHFKGLHDGTELTLNSKQQELYQTTHISGIYPEYYLLKVNKFNDLAKDSLDEWMYYLKYSMLPDKYSAKGLDQVSEILIKDKMDKDTFLQYEAHVKEMRIKYGEIQSAKLDGRDEGKAEGIAEGIEKEKISIIQIGYKKGLSVDFLADLTGLSIEFVKKILLVE